MSLSGRRKRGEGSAAEMIGVSTPDDLQTGLRMCPATGFHGSHNGRLVHDPYRDTPAFLVENGKAPDTDHPTGNTGHDHPPSPYRAQGRARRVLRRRPSLQISQTICRWTPRPGRGSRGLRPRRGEPRPVPNPCDSCDGTLVTCRTQQDQPGLHPNTTPPASTLQVACDPTGTPAWLPGPGLGHDPLRKSPPTHRSPQALPRHPR